MLAIGSGAGLVGATPPFTACFHPIYWLRLPNETP
jgi:hypothetical protein